MDRVQNRPMMTRELSLTIQRYPHSGRTNNDDKYSLLTATSLIELD